MDARELARSVRLREQYLHASYIRRSGLYGQQVGFNQFNLFAQAEYIPNVYRMYTECIPNVYRIYTECIPNVHIPNTEFQMTFIYDLEVCSNLILIQEKRDEWARKKVSL